MLTLQLSLVSKKVVQMALLVLKKLPCAKQKKIYKESAL